MRDRTARNEAVYNSDSLPIEPEHKGILPQIDRTIDFKDNEPELDPEIITGILRENSKLLLSAPSKGAKSFLAVRLALCFAYGLPWLKHQCKQCKVLILNFELKKGTYWNRTKAVAGALAVSPYSENIDIWNLRGISFDIEELIPELIERIRNNGYKVIIIDPQYKLYRSERIRAFNENSTGDMAYLYGVLDKIMYELGIALIIVNHFSKGLQGSKNAMDRMAGSGATARDADAIGTMSELEENDCYRLEFALREFKTPEPISLRWEYPIHAIDEMLNETPIKGARATTNSKDRIKASENDDRVIIELITENADQSKNKIISLAQKRGLSQHRAQDAINRNEVAGLIECVQGARRALLCRLK